MVVGFFSRFVVRRLRRWVVAVMTVFAAAGLGLVGVQSASAKTVDLGAPGGWLTSVAVDGSGNAYASRIYGKSITKISPTGKMTIAYTSSDATTDEITGVAVSKPGTLYFVTYRGKVVVRVLPDGTSSTFTCQACSSLEGPVVGADGNVYVVNRFGVVGDTRDARAEVLRMSPEGNFESLGTLPGSSVGEEVKVAVSPTGVVHTLSSVSERYRAVYRFDEGGVLTTLKKFPSGVSVYDIQVDAAGTVYTTTTTTTAIYGKPDYVIAKNGWVTKISPAGESKIMGYTDFAYDLALDPAGNAYVGKAGAITKISPTGKVTLVGVRTGSSGLVRSATGDLYTFNSYAESPSGGFTGDHVFRTTPSLEPRLAQKPRVGKCATTGIPKSLPRGRAVTLRMDPDSACGVSNAVTEQGQRIAVKVTPAKVSDAKSYSLYCLYQGQQLKTRAVKAYGSAYRVCDYGQLTIRTARKSMRLAITWYAPPSAVYAAYKATKTYTT